MGDILKKVQPGQPFRMPAAAYNAFIDTALEQRQTRQNIDSHASPPHAQLGIISIKNQTGSNRSRFSVLAVTDSLLDAGSDEFKNRVVFECGLPMVSSPRFVVTAAPIRNGEIGPAYAFGICPVKIDVTDDVHQHANATAMNSQYLTSNHGGGAAILWREGGEGLQWAVVQLTGFELPPAPDVDVDPEKTDGRVVEVGLKWYTPESRTIVPVVTEKFNQLVDAANESGEIVKVKLQYDSQLERIVPVVTEGYDALVDPEDESGEIVKVKLQYDSQLERIVPVVDDSSIPEGLDVSQMVQESEYADPENKLVEVEFDTEAAGDGELKLHIDDTAVAEALEGIPTGGAEIAEASQTPQVSRVLACTLGGESISVYNLDGHTWNEYPGLATGEKVAVWHLPAPLEGCDYVGTPLDQFQQYYHEFFCIGTAFSGLDSINLTVNYSLSYNTLGYVENVRTYDGAIWSTKYPNIAVGTPVIVARVNAANEYVGHPVLPVGPALPFVVQVKATGNPPASASRSAERVDNSESITVYVQGGNWSAAFPVVKENDYFWAVRVATDPDVWYGFPSFDFRIGIGEVE